MNNRERGWPEEAGMTDQIERAPDGRPTGNATQSVVRAWNRRAPILGADGMEMLEGME